MSRTARGPSAALRLAAFAALASFVALHWIALVGDPPIGRAAVALIAVCGGATTLALIARAGIPRVPAWTLALVASLVATAASAIAIGLQARLLAPANWGELVDHLVAGVEDLENADYPYGGSDPWTRLAILFGLPLGLGLAAALAFWPVRRGAPALRTLALVTLVGVYATAATLNPPGAPLLRGFGLALLVAAWLWLPALRRRDALSWAAFVIVAGALALPLAAKLDVERPWLDYRHWGWRQSAPLNPKWVHRIGFDVRGLRSQLVVGAGTILSVEGVDGPTPIASGLAMPPGEPLEDGDSYTVRAYAPNPSPDRMRATPVDYPRALGRYSTIAVPRRLATGGRPPPGTPDEAAVPLRGRNPDGGSPAERLISTSPYGGIYRLARRLTTGAPTTYDAVNRIEGYLRGNYDYSESPPNHRYPLRAFLFKDRAGYCQQFSGTMALMLRMLGIPSRVASGFSPGTPKTGGGGFLVRDFDAHSWVEVYFNRIGWVPFDPTPGAAPANSQASGLRPPAPNGPSAAKPLPGRRSGPLKLRRGGPWAAAPP